MVDLGGGATDASDVPTIAELLASYKDRTGYSYPDLSKKVRNELGSGRIHQLVKYPVKAFPDPRTIELLAELLEVSVTTIVLSFAASLGIPVTLEGSHLAISLPQGTDLLDADDVAAVRAVIRQLVQARREAQMAETLRLALERIEQQESNVVDLARPPAPDLSRVAARRGTSAGKAAREQQDRDAED